MGKKLFDHGAEEVRPIRLSMGLVKVKGIIVGQGRNKSEGMDVGRVRAELISMHAAHVEAVVAMENMRNVFRDISGPMLGRLIARRVITGICVMGVVDTRRGFGLSR